MRDQIAEGVEAYLSACLNSALEQEETLLLGREPYGRGDSGVKAGITAYCLKCGSRRPGDWWRNGHKQRRLVTVWGRQLTLWMPRLKCRCGGTVHVRFQTVAPRQRLWHDVSAEVREAYGRGQSLREIKEHLEGAAHTSLGLRWLDEQLHAMAALVSSWQEASGAACPPVIALDALWMRVAVKTGRKRRDRRGRKRAVKRVVKRPIMVALGLWPEEERREILDWEIGDQSGEDTASWGRLLTRLEERGVRGAKGLRLIIHDGSGALEEALEEVYLGAAQQRCVFHKLRNLGRAVVVPAGMPSAAAKEVRKRVLTEASAIWRARSKAEASQRYALFCAAWREAQPEVVATLERDFASTLTFYDLLAWAAEKGVIWPAAWLRTTSPLERINRSFRRKLRQMVIAHSDTGLRAVLLQMTIRTEHAAGADPPAWPSYIEQLLCHSP